VSRQPHDFEALYAGTPPWDIGRPQTAFLELAQAGVLGGRVLDVGCGTGEHTLMAAGLGLEAIGIDIAAVAIARAEGKARDRGLAARFVVWDALQLAALGEQFDTVLDCGLFHAFDGDERPEYVASLASVTGSDATLYVLCFSDVGPDTGPHPVSRDELAAPFGPGSGWHVAGIEADRVLTRFHDDHGAPAWLATVTRV
jgi:SAM-dependent methyltransferase